jgi:hypothetical protein
MSLVREEERVDSSALKLRDGMVYKRVPACVVLLRLIHAKCVNERKY